MTYRLLLAYVPLLSSPVYAQPAPIEVRVCIDDVRFWIPRSAIEGAASLVSDIYGEAGITLDWTHRSSEDRTASRCPDRTVRIGISFVRVKPARASLHALALTSFYGASAQTTDVYYGAVEAYANSMKMPITVALGYVVAHEIGHVLLGQEHTASGIMRAKWTSDDFARMHVRHLRFVEHERALLHSSACRQLENAATAVDAQIHLDGRNAEIRTTR